jgi:H+-transporting ATPase
MYLKLSVAGHLTIFLTRTRGPFWSIRPAKILWIAVLGTQTVATLIAVYGLFMTPLGWKLAGLVWAYALVCFLLTDRVKLLGYKLLDHVDADAPNPEVKADAPKQEAKATEAKPDDKAGQPKPEAKVQEPKPEIKAEAKPAATAEAKTEAKAEPQPEAKSKAPSDLQPRIAKLAYELYEERGRGESSAVQDWKQAEREIRKDEAKSDPKAQAKVEPETGAKPDTGPDDKASEPKPDDKAGQPRPEPKAEAPKEQGKAAEPKPDDKVNQPKSEAKADPKPDVKDKTQSDVTPRLVKRVHELYEELGREEVEAVQEWENAKQGLQKNDSRK